MLFMAKMVDSKALVAQTPIKEYQLSSTKGPALVTFRSGSINCACKITAQCQTMQRPKLSAATYAL